MARQQEWGGVGAASRHMVAETSGQEDSSRTRPTAPSSTSRRSCRSTPPGVDAVRRHRAGRLFAWIAVVPPARCTPGSRGRLSTYMQRSAGCHVTQASEDQT